MKTKAISILSDLLQAGRGNLRSKPATPLFALLLAAATPMATAQTAQPPAPSGVTGTNDVPWSVVERGPHSRIWQRTLSHPGPNGKPVQRVHRYTELQTGLHYKKDGQWVESSETITPTADGATATNGQIQVRWLGNLNSAGAVDMTTPDGKRLRSNILGIGFADASGKSVLIGQIKDSIGEILPSGNEALYQDAFTNLHADVMYQYKKGYFEQFVVFREQLPSPTDYGLDPASTIVEIWTEFLDAPTPSVTTASSETGEDQFLGFGAMYMVKGDAFAIGSPTNRIPVSKEWVTTDQRTALVEKVPFQSLLPLLQTLPASNGGSAQAAPRPPRDLPSAAPFPESKPRFLALLPNPRLRTTHQRLRTNPSMKLASTAPTERGIAADYLIVTTQSNVVFQADMTYYVNSWVVLRGTNIFEGGSVIKYAPNARISLYQCASDQFMREI